MRLDAPFSDDERPGLISNKRSARNTMRIPLSLAEKRQSTDGQPLCYQNVAIVEENGVMRGDEFPRCELGT